MLVEYIVKWYVPQLTIWEVVGTYRDLESAQEAVAWFAAKIRENWTGDLEIGIVKRTEEELS